MNQVRLALEDQVVALNYPPELKSDIEALFGQQQVLYGAPSRAIEVREEGSGRYSLKSEGKTKAISLSRDDCLVFLVGEVVHALITGLNTGVVMHSGAVLWEGEGVLLPGKTGVGKSSLSAWLAGKGFTYLTDECAVLRPDVPHFVPLRRPLVTKNGVRTSVLDGLDTPPIVSGSTAIFWPQNERLSEQPYASRLVVFPRFEQGAPMRVNSLSAAEAAFELTACNVNARNLPDHGLGIVTSFARNVPAISVRYGSFDQLEDAFDELLKLIIRSDLDPTAIRRALSLFKNSGDAVGSKKSAEFPPKPKGPSVAPVATPRGEPRKLTIGMAAYDDYDGVFFTLQALRMYHPEILEATEFLVIDNNPEGACAAPMKALENFAPNYRYVPCYDKAGTAVRDRVFEESSGELVLCIDCHVFIVPGAVDRLIKYYDAHPDTNDLLQGPLIYDDLRTFSTHFEPAWREGMFGLWVADGRGGDPDAAPFDIPMQGLGLFACRRAVWPGFNTRFRGFGGEEGYIHEKFRRAGGRVLCLPFLRWMHRFNRPMGIPYVNTWDDRIRNYMVGFTELGLDLKPLKDHFTEFLGPWIAHPIFERVEAELADYKASNQLTK